MKPAVAAARPPKRCTDCALRVQTCFTQVSATDLTWIETFRSGTRAVPAGQSVFAEQSKISQLFTVYSGWAFRYKTLADGSRQILNFLLAGDLVGLQAEFANKATHGVEALTDVQLCVFPQDGLWSLFQSQPQLGYDITWLSASNEYLVDENLVTVGSRNAEQRVAMLLIDLWRRAERLGLAAPDGSIAFPLTQQHIADALGLSLVHTNKTLRKLERVGLHEIAAGRLRLLQPQALERIADYSTRPMRKLPLI